MGLHSNVPFSLIFEQGYKRQEVTNFCTDAHFPDTFVPVEIIENVELKVTFNSNDDQAKFYFEGLESIELQDDGEGDDERFITPSPEPLVLFKNDYFPLIPGKYLLKVVQAGISYYSIVKVSPKQITEDQWEMMKREIEGYVQGLGRELVKSHSFFPDDHNDLFSPNRLSQIQIIEKHYHSLMAAMNDLYSKANYRVKKEYKMMAAERAKKLDERTIGHRMRRLESDQKLLAPSPTFDYDLPENRWVKKIIGFLLNVLKEWNEIAGQYLDQLQMDRRELERFSSYQENTRLEMNDKVRTLEEFSCFYRETKKMYSSLLFMTRAGWYKEVKEPRLEPPNQVMFLDSRYRAIYRVYRDLKKERLEPLAKTYRLQWKRSEKLYELWGILQLIEMLKELDFTPYDGWVFSNAMKQIPTLEPGTIISFKKETIRVNLVYDTEIPLVGRETDRNSHPIYTSSRNNRPDARLDLFQDRLFIGSLMIDFKYRPLKYIWDHSLLKTRTKLTSMEQLLNYSSACRSLYLFGAGSIATSINPVYEVWAAYPDQYGEDQASIKSDDFDIRLVPLTPGKSKKRAIDDLRSVIRGMLIRKNQFHLFNVPSSGQLME
ncbi:DUF2357 domain-containing protein [Fictibacillus sp. Mic-4]|uniref:DUF2357 domain-containing protein n=1 Tax=Fictibacillus sp. Mic-4 TaxID=3132826 RepID=UPI003CF4C671